MEVIEQLEYALLEALNYVDELPILPPNPTPDTVDRFSMMRQLFDDLYAEARFKGYAPAHRQGRATRWSPTSSQLEEELPSPQNSQQQVRKSSIQKLEIYSFSIAAYTQYGQGKSAIASYS